MSLWPGPHHNAGAEGVAQQSVSVANMRPHAAPAANEMTADAIQFGPTPKHVPAPKPNRDGLLGRPHAAILPDPNPMRRGRRRWFGLDPDDD